MSHSATITPSPSPRPDQQLGRGLSPMPLQEPELFYSRNRLPGLLLQTASNSDEDIIQCQYIRRHQAAAFNNPHMRYMRLIGDNNPRYQWEQYRKSPEELKGMKKPLREYYKRNNSLIDQYIYIDKLLDSTLPRDLLQTYHDNSDMETANEGLRSLQNSRDIDGGYTDAYGSTDSLSNLLQVQASRPPAPQRKRLSYIYKIADEESPLLQGEAHGGSGGGGSEESHASIVKTAIYISFGANGILLVSKLLATVLTNSLSVLASLVDGILDFLSTVIVATTARLMRRKDSYTYPIGRSRLEPLGVLVFSVVMVTSFVQVGITALQRLFGSERRVVTVGPTAIAIMASTVAVKGACYFWCRLIRNSSVQALAEDAFTDVIFNFFSIIFPLLGSFTNQWYLDPLGGLILSIYVVVAWVRISTGHIKNLTGAAASADQRNVLLYTTMRFARSIRQITSVHAYHAGDKVNVEVDVVLDDGLGLRDSHDLGECLQYTLESLPTVERAFVHLDYDSRNPPGHLR